jgi:hypothetical protein
LPELRSRYPLPLVRLAIDLSILAVLALSGLSMLLRRKKALGLAGLALAALALAWARAAWRSSGRASAFYLGLDWFVLGVLTTAALFVPLERPSRCGAGRVRSVAGWLTDTQYFFMSHALVQLMSVLVLAPAVSLGAVLAVPALQQAVQIGAAGRAVRRLRAGGGPRAIRRAPGVPRRALPVAVPRGPPFGRGDGLDRRIAAAPARRDRDARAGAAAAGRAGVRYARGLCLPRAGLVPRGVHPRQLRPARRMARAVDRDAALPPLAPCHRAGGGRP